MCIIFVLNSTAAPLTREHEEGVSTCTTKKCAVFVLHSTAAPLTREHEGVSTCTTRMYSSSSTFYAQNPALEIVHRQKRVNVYLHIHVQRECSAAASCVTKDLQISPRFSPTIFYRGSNSVLLRAHLCTAVDSMRKTQGSKLFMRRA